MLPEVVSLTLQESPWDLTLFVPSSFLLAGVQIQWLEFKQLPHTVLKKPCAEDGGAPKWKVPCPLGHGLPLLLHNLLSHVSLLVGCSLEVN